MYLQSKEMYVDIIILIVFICLVIAFQLAYIFHINKKNTTVVNKSNDRKLKDIKPGERIKVNISGFVVNAVCLNNKPADKKMFIRIYHGSGSVSDSIENYDAFTFSNFNALNNFDKQNPESLKDELNQQLRIAVQNERYEEAGILRDAILKLEVAQKEKAKDTLEVKI